MRIAVFGTGGVGGYFGGRLAEAGCSVVFIARGAHLEAIRREGLRVESVAGDFVVSPAEATDSPESVGPVDVVLVAVKGWQVPEAATAMVPLVGAESIVVPLQNGVEAADQLAAVLGSGRVLGGLCRIISYVSGPGRIRHAGVDPTLELGEREGPDRGRASGLLAAFGKAKGVAARLAEDIEVAVWEKFLFIAPLGGVGAVTRTTADVFRAVPETREMLAEAMREVLHLARARGVAIRDDAVERALRYIDTLPEGSIASMHRDFLAGRPSELESLNGAVVRLAREAGVPAPVNGNIYRSLLPSELRARQAPG
jgi:2-dehydropantoate 2-reductase